MVTPTPTTLREQYAPYLCSVGSHPVSGLLRRMPKVVVMGGLATVTTGPNADRSWTGDLVLTQHDTGAFTGVLVPSSAVDRQTLEVRDRSGAMCRAVGQRNNAQVSWFLYCQGNERIFGTGQITAVGNEQELRGILSGPTDRDFGVYHGRNYPPYIRIISPDFN
jgi:hypothetical protein